MHSKNTTNMMTIKDNIKEIIIIGSGNWGLTLACLFSSDHLVRVWTINRAQAEELKAKRNYHRPYFKYNIPEAIVIEEKYGSCFDPSSTLFIIAVPSSQVIVAFVVSILYCKIFNIPAFILIKHLVKDYICSNNVEKSVRA